MATSEDIKMAVDNSMTRRPPRLRPVTTSPPRTLIPSDRGTTSDRGAAHHAT